MTLKFIKNITSEGKRKVINIPKKHYEDLKLGEKVLVSKIDYNKMTKEELKELIK
ncbi:MAG: hypothetical protein GWP19_07115 [Planctomycetia bacterium]|nr:hypothetical protein [Planctomycetia bacterium]